ncbi:unnamed protein product [Periconia digitata]|uniref:AA9 family lytic polysaccharide monooxygenase n=1 Tax=Periconia digitata TaxID=1303443 RepID=A0A9W4XPF0_9PLEO|nr:unnamed protein product [Periconia digitata]
MRLTPWRQSVISRPVVAVSRFGTGVTKRPPLALVARLAIHAPGTHAYTNTRQGEIWYTNRDFAMRMARVVEMSATLRSWPSKPVACSGYVCGNKIVLAGMTVNRVLPSWPAIFTHQNPTLSRPRSHPFFLFLLHLDRCSTLRKTITVILQVLATQLSFVAYTTEPAIGYQRSTTTIRIMKTQSVLVAALAAAPSALAHTAWTNFYIDGLDQGDAVGVRMRKDPAKTTFPINNYASDDMACNVDGTTGVSRVQPIKDGSTLTFEMRSWPDDKSKESLARQHYGPCAFYLKKVSSAVEDKGAGDGWFKLYEQGYNKDTDRWCTDDLIDNKGHFSVKIPENLAGGYYLARPEVLALHNATNGDGQFYLGCGQIFVDSKGDLGPEKGSTVSIPGYVKAGDPSVQFNIYNKKNDQYKVAGPPVAKLVSGASSKSETTQTEGLKPEGCILENGNWCGKEVSSYSDEKGCWASGEECWAQDKKCWAEAGPTGGKLCKIWSAKCTAMNDACTAKQFTGPPNKGKDLTPEKAKIDVGPVMGSKLEVVQGDAAAAPSSSSNDNSKAEETSVAAEVEPAPSSSAAAQPAPSSQAAPSSSQAAPTQVEQSMPSATGNRDNGRPYTKTRSKSRPSASVTKAPGPVVTETAVVYQTVYERRRGVHHRRMRGL